MKKLTILLLALFVFNLTNAQLVVSDSLTQIQMVEALSGPGVNFSNIQVNCPGGTDFNGNQVSQMAQFDGSMSNIGIDAGLLLSSGGVDSTLQSNNDFINDWTNPNNPDPNTFMNYGDLDLDLIVSPDETNDACVIEFDLQMSGDTLKFNYVFASEEYPEFVNSFNDVFAFFISGPTVVGPYSSPVGFPNGSENIAVLPGTSTAVTINNINNGSNDCFSGGPNGPCMNCQYYVDNCGGATVEYDGFTTKLEAKIPVTPCETYHLKLAVADVNDGSFDSGVFLENGSFASSEFNFGTAFTDVFEGCTEGGIDFNRKDTTKQDSVTIYFGFGGTAVNGTDYGLEDELGNFVPFPDDILLLPGVNDTTLNIVGNDDATNEADEEIVIYVYIDDCLNGQIAIDSINLTLHDDIYINLMPDTLVCPNEEITLKLNYDVDTAAIDSIHFSAYTQLNSSMLQNISIFNNDSGFYSVDSLISYSAINDTYLTFYIQDTFNCKGVDTMFYDVLEPESLDFTFEFLDLDSDSLIDSVLFTNLSTFPNDVTYFWNFGDSLNSESNEFSPQFVFGDTGIYLVSLTAEGEDVVDCPLFKEIVVIWREIPKPPSVYPNVITPNDDGVNDFFYVYGYSKYNLFIYNRWGKLVYENIYYEDTFDGEGLNDGLYFYKILDPKTFEEQKGWFQIMR